MELVRSRRDAVVASSIALVAAAVLPTVAESVVITPAPDRLVQRISLRVIFGVLVFVISLFVMHFGRQVRAGDPVYRRWLTVAAAYFAIAGSVLMLLWPGYWVWDEFAVMEGVEAGQLPVWQGLLTSIYYVMAMNLFPSGVAIPVVQAIVASMAVGWIVARTAELLRRPWLAYLLVLPFLSFPVLLNNAYPLRLTMYSYIELILLFRLIFIGLRPDLVTHRYREFFGLSTAITLLALWRTEGIYYFLLIPVLFFALRIFRMRHEYARAIVATVGVAAVALCGYAVNSRSTDPNYQITAIVNPLSQMLQHPLRGNVDQNLAAIDRVIDVELVRAMPDYSESPAFWSGGRRANSALYIPGALRAFADLARDNPGPFLEARTRTFLAVSSIGTAGTVGGHYIGNPPPDTTAIRTREALESRQLFMEPWSKRVRKATVQTLLMADSNRLHTTIGRLTWNVIPVHVMLLVLFFAAVVRRRWLYVGIATLILARALLLFLTIPATYFMYYLPIYMSGLAFAIFVAIRFADSRFDVPSDPLAMPLIRVVNKVAWIPRLRLWIAGPERAADPK